MFKTVLKLLAISLLTISCNKQTDATTTTTTTTTQLAPSQYFNLSNFELFLPIDQYGGNGGTNGTQYAAAQKTSSDLTGGFVDDYFYANSSGQLLFTAPSNGATTTPGSGSDHTRSELREMYSGTGAVANHYAWTSVIGGVLTATVSVQSVSVNASIGIFGQLHGINGPFVVLGYRPASKTITVSIYDTYSGTTSTLHTLASSINIGDTITYSMSYSGTNLAITVNNGTTQNFTIDSSWSGTGVYFTLGAYHVVANTGNPSGDQTQMKFTSFSITH